MLKVVLITSNSSGKWIIPKGIVERHLSPAESAAKEAFEEAGVIGSVSSELLTEYEYDKWGGTCRVQVFPLEVSEVLETWDEMNSRSRQIVPAVDAATMVKPALREVVEEFLAVYSSAS